MGEAKQKNIIIVQFLSVTRFHPNPFPNTKGNVLFPSHPMVITLMPRHSTIKRENC